MPRPQRYTEVRPMRDLVLVRVLEAETDAMWTSGLHLPQKRRVFPVLVAEVIAAGPLTPAEIRPGARVLMEVMSGPEDGQPSLDGADLGLHPGRLAFVHCRDLRAPIALEERAKREARKDEIRALVQKIDASPWRKKKLAEERAQLIVELEDHILRIDEIDEAWAKCGRARGVKIVKDKGMARGVLAVLDE